MYKEIEKILSSIHVYPSLNCFPNWKELGVEHGFEGIGGHSINGHHLTQVHGASCVEASATTAWDSQDRPEGDALFTSKSESVAVKTADCVPLLIHTSNIVIAVHGGWKGLCAGIVQEALKLSGTQNILVGIGPHISSYSFEIGEDVKGKFESQMDLDSKQWPWLLSKGVGDRWHIDIGLAALFTCINLGVDPSSISLMRTCTKLNSSDWHSYRRDGVESGRNWSWIVGPK